MAAPNAEELDHGGYRRPRLADDVEVALAPLGWSLGLGTGVAPDMVRDGLHGLVTRISAISTPARGTARALALVAAHLSPLVRAVAREEMTAIGRLLNRSELDALSGDLVEPARRGAAVLAAYADEFVNAADAVDVQASTTGRDSDTTDPDALLSVALDGRSAEARLDAVAGLLRCDPRARVSCAEALAFAKDPDVRAAAIDLLDPAEPGHAEIACLFVSSADERTVARAADVVAASKPSVAVAVLWGAAASAHGGSRRVLLRRLAQLDAEALWWLARSMEVSEDSERKVLGIESLSQFDHVPSVRYSAALTDPDPATRSAALEALGAQVGDGCTDAIAMRLGDPDPAIRATAVRLLHQRDPDRFLGEVVSAAGDPAASVRAVALDILATTANARDIERVVAGLRHPSTRGAAVAVLVRLGERAIPAVVDELLRSEDSNRETVAAVLRQMAPEEALRSMMAHRDPSQRLRAAETIAALGGTDAAAVIAQLLDDPEPAVRMRAAELVGDLGDTAIGSRVSAANVREPLPDVAAAMERALRKIGKRLMDAGRWVASTTAQ